MGQGFEQTNVGAWRATSWAKALSRRMWARADYWNVRDMIPTTIGMLYVAFGRAPLDGEGALHAHWREPVHMDV